MWTWVKRFGRDQEGAVAISYILTIAMVAAAMMPALSMLKDSAGQQLAASTERIRLVSGSMSTGSPVQNAGRLIIVRHGDSEPYESAVTQQ